jgi:DNA-binding transcriptional ArsR family regulator
VSEKGAARQTKSLRFEVLAFRREAKYISHVSETEQEFDGLVRALANPHRRRIVQECWSAARSAGEIADLLDLAPASASEHLKVLRKHGLIDLTINGTFRIYQTRRQAVLRLRGLFEAVFPMEEP